MMSCVLASFSSSMAVSLNTRGTKVKLALCLNSLLLFACLVGTEGRDFLRSCYFVNWAYGRTSPFTRFDVEHIDPYVCTHLIYAFAKIDPNQARIVPTDPTQDLPSKGKKGRFVTFNELKKTYKHLKTILSVGGEYAQESQFTSVNKDQSTLQTFTQTTVQFLRRWGFDGLDIDWEFPHHGTKATFVRILKALHTAFEANRTNGERLILTAALAAGRHNIDSGYDVKALAKYLDLANLMTYDYHGSWNFATGFDSPLYSRKSAPSINQELSVNWTVHYYISEGIPANKILVGVTAAGTRYKLTDTSKTGVGAPSVNNWRPESRLWKLHARYAYPEICQILQRTDTKHVFDKEQQVPYLYFSNEWCGYDDVQSVKIKREWMLKVGVAGAMFWAMDMDDFTGRMCALGKYPLLRALSGIEDNRQGGGGSYREGGGGSSGGGGGGSSGGGGGGRGGGGGGGENTGGSAAHLPSAAGPWGLCLAVLFFVSVWFARFF